MEGQLNVAIVEHRAPEELPAARAVAAYAEIDRDEWLRIRREGIGGSDAAAIVGYSKYQSQLGLWMLKTGRMEQEDVGEAAEVGTLLEPFMRGTVLPAYLGGKGIRFDTIIDPEYSYQNTVYPWLRVNLDGFVVVDGELVGLEIKTGGSYQLKDWGGMDGDDVPDAYWAQCQHAMAATGLDRFLVFGLIGNRRLHRWIERDDAWIDEKLLPEEKTFWDRVQANDPFNAPAPSGLDVDDLALSELNTPVEDREVDLSMFDYVLGQYKAAVDEIKRYEGVKKRLQQEIKVALGTANRGTGNFHKVSRITTTRSRFDATRYAKEHPDLVADYMVESTVDYPRVTEIKR